MTAQLITLLVLLILSAFFSAAEVAFVTLTQAKVEAMVKCRLPRSKQIRKLKKSPRKLLVAILIGNNVVNIGASSLATVVMANFFDSAVIGITTGIMTLLVLVFGEIIPKSYATNHPKKFAIFATPIVRFLIFFLYPFIIIFEGITNVVAGKETADSISEEELLALAKSGTKQGVIEHAEGVMIERLFAFNDITAEDIMTPRVNIISMYHNGTVKEAIEVIEVNPFTRYPVMKKTPDNIVGFVHARDVLLAQKKKKKQIKSILRPMLTVPKQMKIDELMKEFQKRSTHMAVVVDEFGGTEGIITFEDVIEELVGEIADEHDIDKNLMRRIDKHTVIVAGNATLRSIGSFFNCAIPGKKLDTIAEIVLDHLEKLPRKGHTVDIGPVTCTILEIKKRRIEKVQLTRVT